METLTLKKELPSIQRIINDKLLSDREAEGKREIKSWHASGLGSCMTGRYLERMGVKPDVEIDERTLRVFSVGNLFEQWLIDIVSKSGKEYQTQIRFELSQNSLSGRADLLIKYEDKTILYECKSKHSRAFWYMNKGGQGAMEQHRRQLWVGLKALNIEEGRLVYLSKDDLCVLEYPVYLNEAVLEKDVKSELDVLNLSWELKIPPPPAPDKTWQAEYCRWHKQCVKQEKYLPVDSLVLDGIYKQNTTKKKKLKVTL